MTLSKYRHDTKCEQHVIYNNRLMTHTKTSPVIYTKRGVSRNDRMKLEEMTDFLIIMGIGFTTLLLAVVIYLMWILFLWPFVEAVSLTRMTREYWRINGCKRGVWRTIRLFLLRGMLKQYLAVGLRPSIPVAGDGKLLVNGGSIKMSRIKEEREND